MTICTIIAKSVALPKTYQYLAPPGTSSVKKSFVIETKPVRFSIQLSISNYLCLIRHDDALRCVGLIDDPRHLGGAVALAERERIQAARRRTGDVRSVESVLRPVARAHEPVVRVAPVVVAAQMRADRTKDDEAHVDRRIRKVAVCPGDAENIGSRRSELLEVDLDAPSVLRR